MSAFSSEQYRIAREGPGVSADSGKLAEMELFLRHAKHNEFGRRFSALYEKLQEELESPSDAGDHAEAEARQALEEENERNAPILERRLAALHERRDQELAAVEKKGYGTSLLEKADERLFWAPLFRRFADEIHFDAEKFWEFAIMGIGDSKKTEPKGSFTLAELLTCYLEHAHEVYSSHAFGRGNSARHWIASPDSTPQEHFFQVANSPGFFLSLSEATKRGGDDVTDEAREFVRAVLHHPDRPGHKVSPDFSIKRLSRIRGARFERDDDERIHVLLVGTDLWESSFQEILQAAMANDRIIKSAHDWTGAEAHFDWALVRRPEVIEFMVHSLLDEDLRDEVVELRGENHLFDQRGQWDIRHKLFTALGRTLQRAQIHLRVADEEKALHEEFGPKDFDQWIRVKAANKAADALLEGLSREGLLFEDLMKAAPPCTKRV